jgi:excisionase family DNA binding protein
MEERKEWYSIKELAEWLGIHPDTVRKLDRTGQILCHRIGKNKRFRRDDIEKYLESVRGAGGGAV